ncbi:unnamed protein product, partial [marine sediment metagenome]
RRKIEEEEIEKNGYENGLKKRFSFVKENERSNDKMSYYEYADSADNSSDNEKLIDEIREFYDEGIDEDLEKQIKVIPKKLQEALKESFKILNSYKSEMEDIPDLLAAV